MDPNNNQRPSSFYVEKGNFAVRNLQIGWNLPKDLCAKAKMTDVMYLTGNNLFTVTNYRGFDPDIGTSGWILTPALTKALTTAPGAGISVSF